jgi:hypothetical protein
MSAMQEELRSQAHSLLDRALEPSASPPERAVTLAFLRKSVEFSAAASAYERAMISIANGTWCPQPARPPGNRATRKDGFPSDAKAF